MERLAKGEWDGWSGGELTSGEIFGVLFALKHLADHVGLTRVLGTAPESKLNLFLVLAAHRPWRKKAVGGALGGAAHGGRCVLARVCLKRTTCMRRWTGWRASKNGSSGSCTRIT